MDSSNSEKLGRQRMCEENNHARIYDDPQDGGEDCYCGRMKITREIEEIIHKFNPAIDGTGLSIYKYLQDNYII